MIDFNNVLCLINVIIYLALAIGIVGSSAPKKKRKRSGTWTQQDAQATIKSSKEKTS
jgi:hypothetical protein